MSFEKSSDEPKSSAAEKIEQELERIRDAMRWNQEAISRYEETFGGSSSRSSETGCDLLARRFEHLKSVQNEDNQALKNLAEELARRNKEK